MSTRRTFLRRAGLTAGALGTGWAPALSAAVSRKVGRRKGHSAEAVARDEDFWRPIQEAWPVDRSLLNLNNGGVSPSPWKAQESLRRLTEFANQAPAYNMWRIQEPQKENVRRDLARLFGADSEQIAIVRNATEALEIATFGLDLEPGDEVLSTDQDYPRMVNAWNQRAQRDGIVFRQISLPTPLDRVETAVQAFRGALTPKTKVVHFSHAINLNGQVLPARELCRLIRDHGAISIVDGAHAFAHLVFDGGGLDCDYYGTSLHKWLSAPVGNGMLYVRKGLVEKTWPLFAHHDPKSADIRKFEQFGTHPVPIILSVAESIALHESIGAERKEARLLYLRDRWADALRPLPNVRFHTPFAEGFAGGIATVEIEGTPANDVNRHLFNQHRIVATGITHEQFSGLRVSPHLYTRLEEIDRFAGVMKGVAVDGLPG